MTQATVLAPGNTEAVSTDITVAAGASVTIGIYADSAAKLLPASVSFNVMIDTPGGDNWAARLDNRQRQTVLAGPGVFRVKRPAYAGDAFGVFTEA